ncbi:MAG: flagellar basal body-associated FliL family protein [Micropepsaceae bacterium]
MASDKEADKSKADGEVPEGAEGAEAAKPKGRFAFLTNKKTLMFVVAPVLLLLIAGGVYFFLFTGGEEVVAEGGEAGAHGEAPAAAAEHHPVFFEVPDILVNVASSDGKPVFLKLAVSLELEEGTDEAATADLEPVMPRVVDQLQTYLRELRIEDLSGSAAMFRLKEELLRRVNLAAEPIKVKSVLFREMIIQ